MKFRYQICENRLNACDNEIAADGPLKTELLVPLPPFRNATAHGPSARAARSMDMAVKAVLLVIYLIGAICTAWCLSVPTVSREHRSFLRICFVIWPFIVTVFGVFVLLALLAHWYDGWISPLRVTERISSKALPPLPRPTLENDSQARIHAAQAGGRRCEKWSQRRRCSSALVSP